MPARWSPSRVLGFGVVRGLLWAREIRFFTVAMVLTLLYALGKYTPVFHLIYDIVPGVTLYRRPADATFVFCALLAMLAGYLVHRLLTGTVPPPRRWQRVAGDCRLRSRLSAIAIGARAVGRRAARAPRCRSSGASDLPRPRSRRWRWRGGLPARSALAAAAVLAAFSVADLGWNNAPNESTGLQARAYTRRCARTPRTKPSRC